jgi:hypothetical protein
MKRKLQPSSPSPRSPRWNLDDYSRWLLYCLEQLEFYRRGDSPLPKGVTRFTYWDSAPIARAAWLRLDPSAEERIDRLEAGSIPLGERRPLWRDAFVRPYRQGYEAAKSGIQRARALFEFARADRDVLMEPFVVRELTDWRRRGMKRRFDQFVTALWDERGRRTPKTLLEEIRRDQRVWRRWCRHTSPGGKRRHLARGQVEHRISEAEHMGVENVRKVRTHYQTFYDRVFANGAAFPLI